MAFPEAIQAIDETILKNAVGTPGWAVPVFFTLTLIGGGWGLLLILPFVFRRTTRIAALCMLSGVLVTSGLVSLLKLAFARARPCDALGWCAAVVIPSPGGFSFPSGHAAGSFAFAAFVAMRVPKLGPFALLCATLIAWSRCILGVHYPSDVLAGSAFGASLGVLFAMASVALEKKVRARANASGPNDKASEALKPALGDGTTSEGQRAAEPDSM